MFKIFRLAIIVVLASLLFAQIWLIFVSIEMIEYNERDADDPGLDNFYISNELGTYTNPARTTLVLYYSFTTLSTVGFGDLSPQSNIERLVMVGVFVTGVAVFSILTENFLDTVK